MEQPSRLPLTYVDRHGLGRYHDYWTHYTKGDTWRRHDDRDPLIQDLMDSWRATIHGGTSAVPPYIVFEDPQLMTLWLLRYS